MRGLLLRTSCVEHDLVARGRATGPAERGGLRGLDGGGGAPLAAASRRARGGDARRMMLDDRGDVDAAATTPRGFMDGIIAADGGPTTCDDECRRRSLVPSPPCVP